MASMINDQLLLIEQIYYANSEIKMFLKLPKLGEARLIALNKKYPDLPKQDQFRPIVVLSPLYKFLELRLLPYLQDFALHKLDRN